MGDTNEKDVAATIIKYFMNIKSLSDSGISLFAKTEKTENDIGTKAFELTEKIQEDIEEIRDLLFEG